MIRNCLSNVDTLIKEHFRGKGRLLVKLLVGQALLIGVLTFFCLTRPGGEDIQAQANLVVDQDAIRNADGNIKVTAEVIIIPSKPNTKKEISYHVLGYILHYKLKLVSVLLVSVCGLLKYLFLGPLLLAKYLVVFLMWLLGCGGKQKVLASPSLVKMICPDVVVDDGKRKLVEAALLLIPSGMVTLIIKKYLSMPKIKDGETILLLNSKGDWEFAPSNKRVAAVKF